tara:strand:+ start:14281 stop:14514 length:234 start_codon:yes stop_codon:yes gene_type:complete
MDYKDLKSNKYAFIGLWGVLVAGVCCFTPLLVWAFAFFGLAALTTYLDYILIPVLLLFIGILLLGIRSINKSKSKIE